MRQSPPKSESSFVDSHALPLPRAIRWAGRIGCGTGAVLLGAGCALQNAEFTTQIEDMDVQTVSAVDFQNTGIAITAEVDSPGMPPTDLGGIQFEHIDDLPLRIDVRLRSNAISVGSALQRPNDYIDGIKAEAKQAAHTATNYYEQRALAGGLIGLAGSEIAVGLGATAFKYRRRQRLSTDEKNTSNTAHFSLRSFATVAAKPVVAGATAAALVTGIGMASYNSEWSNDYQSFGTAAGLLKLPSNRSGIKNIHSTALGQILTTFQDAHACPEARTSSAFASENSLIVTTYNVKQAKQQGVQAVEHQLASTYSDIIMLQEVTPNIVDSLAESLHMNQAHSWTIRSSDFSYGIALLSRFPITSTEEYDLPSTGVEPRHMLTADVILPDKRMVMVATTHLSNVAYGAMGDPREAIREQQAEFEMAKLETAAATNPDIIFGGDLNTTPDSAVYQIINKHFKDTAAQSYAGEATTTPEDGRHIDYIFSPQSWHVDPNTSIRGGGKASDHCELTSVMTPPTEE